MSIAIPSSLATLSSDGGSTPATAAAQTAAAPAASNAEVNDVVQLTKAQQALQLYNEGHTVPQISYSLDLSVQAVNSYLNISKG